MKLIIKKMEKLKTILLIIVLIIGVICTFVPAIYWAMHPQLTYMQIFLKLWWVILLVISSWLGIMRYLKS